MVRGGLIRPAASIAGGGAVTRSPNIGREWGRLGRPSGRWIFVPAIIGTAGVGAASALAPLHALVALLLLGVMACVWRWPALGAYLIIGLTPLSAGVNRGTAVPLLRPNEALVLIVGVALAARGVVGMRSGQVPRLRLSSVEVAIVLLAVCSSIIPLLWMAVRQEQVTSDDILYSLVLWKFLGLYAVIRMSVHTGREILICLRVSVVAACIVALIAIVQALGVFGVRAFLAAYFAPYGYDNAFQARGSATLGLPAATADLMIYNLAIVGGLWSHARRHRALLAAPAALLVLGALSAPAALLILGALSSGEFSSAIGLIVGIVCIAVVTNSTRLLKILLPAALIGSLLLWPVIAARLGGFQSASGLPVSWTGRLQNLENYFWPPLFSDWNFFLGVRPAARVVVTTQATGFVWIESGYTWLLWGGGIPLFGSFVVFAVTSAKLGWRTARRPGAAGIAGAATFVAICVTTALMVFDPHLTYRGSGDELFMLAALAVSVKERAPYASGLRDQTARTVTARTEKEVLT